MLDLRDVTDIAGIDLYRTAPQRSSSLPSLVVADSAPAAVRREFGIPETYNPSVNIDDFNRFIPAGIDDNRMQMAALLANGLEEAREEGIPNTRSAAGILAPATSVGATH